MKKIITIVLFIALAFLLWLGYSQRPLHKPISIKDVTSITLWGNKNGFAYNAQERKATDEEIEKIIEWFNSATDIRGNTEFAGVTSDSGIIIELKSGRNILIIRSGEDFEVQRNDGRMKTISYWAKQSEIRDLLDKLVEFSETDEISKVKEKHPEFPVNIDEVKTEEKNINLYSKIN